MATTTATVTMEGLALSPEFMTQLNLKPGTQVTIILERPSEASKDSEALIRETRGMFAHLGGGMAEELQEMRREDERRFQAKKW